MLSELLALPMLQSFLHSLFLPGGPVLSLDDSKKHLVKKAKTTHPWLQPITKKLSTDGFLSAFYSNSHSHKT